MNYDKKFLTMISLFAVGIFFFIYGVFQSIGFMFIAIVPLVIANRMLFAWENKKGDLFFR